MKIDTVELQIDSLTLMAIIGAMQLSLQHPDFKGQAADIVRTFIDQVTPRLTEIDTMYQVLIDAGFQRGTNN